MSFFIVTRSGTIRYCVSCQHQYLFETFVPTLIQCILSMSASISLLQFLSTLLADQKNAGWYTVVIVVSGCMPDIDGIFSVIQCPPVFSGGIIPSMAFHLRYFHSIGILFVYAVVVAGLLTYYYRLEFRTIALFAGIGFGAHLLEDALVYNPASAVFWPLSSQEVGIGIFPSYSRDFFSIANGEVFSIGIILLVLVVSSSILAKKTGWANLPLDHKPRPPSFFSAIPKILLVFRSYIRSR